MLIKTQTANPLLGWQVDREAIKYLGTDLQRPECILTEPGGTVWTADARGGVVKIDPDGTQKVISPRLAANSTPGPVPGFRQAEESAIPNPQSAIPNPQFEERYIQAKGSLPNGLCFDKNGDFIIANWGTNHIERMTRDGRMTTLLTEIDGQPLGKTNFPLRDSKGRIWFSVTTRTEPWSKQINTRETDGYIALLDETGVRIVADGFCGTNEIRFDDQEEWLYVVESSGWQVSRLRVKPNGALYNREVYAKLPGFPDGFAFDAFGNLWITLIFTDQLVAITPDGTLLTLLDDSNPDTKRRLFEAYENRCVTPEILGSTQGATCPWMASLSFGGPDLKTVYLGSLRGTRVPHFRCPVPGQKMIHWT